MKGRWVHLVIRYGGNGGKCLGKATRTRSRDQLTNLKDEIGNHCE